MHFTIQGIDNEFAVSTGDNIGTTANSSTFDNPPQGSKDLFITTKNGDEDPRLFELGDTYDVSWGGQIGGGSIIDAVVIRSDPSPDGNGTGIIVFEGTDENGEPAQIIWTPGFDLEGWYDDNFNPSMEPQFYTEDMDASYDHRYVCFASQTRLETPSGLRTVGTMRVGDPVTTQDSGPQPVLWIGRRSCAASGENAPVVFAPGAIGNTAPLRVSQQHRMMVKSPLVQLYFGHDEVLVPAKACVNGTDIRIIPAPHIDYVHVLLEHHHVIRAEGALCESLFLGDEAAKALYPDPVLQSLRVDWIAAGHSFATARPVLKMREAALLMQHMRGQTNIRHTRAQPLHLRAKPPIASRHAARFARQCPSAPLAPLTGPR